MSRALTDKEVEYLFSIKQSEIDKQLMKDLFANTSNHKAKFEPNDNFILPAKKYYNSSAIITTVGRFIINKFLLEGKILENIGYQNDVLDKKAIEKLDDKCVSLIDKEILSINEFYEYIDRITWLGYACNNFLAASLSANVYQIPKEVQALKDKLIKENQEEIDKNNPAVVNKIENALIDASKKYFENDPAMDIYNSGCRGSFGNNFKNSVLMRGQVMDFTDPSKLLTSTASLVEGIPKKDFSKFANIMTAASFSRAKNTASGGYMVKQYNSAFQTIQSGEPNSDCGTTKTVKVKLTNFNIGMFKYRYIIEDKKLVLLDETNEKSYIGKTVNMRSPMYCKDECFCSKCLGELYYKNNFNNIGLLASRQGSTIQSLSMKMFHDSTVKSVEFNPEDFISVIE